LKFELEIQSFFSPVSKKVKKKSKFPEKIENNSVNRSLCKIQSGKVSAHLDKWLMSEKHLKLSDG
jgi:hypothetical protein